MNVLDKYVTEINKITPLREYIITHDKGTLDRVKSLYNNLVPKLKRRGSQQNFSRANDIRDVNIPKEDFSNQEDPVKEILSSLIDTSKTVDENIEFILEFVRVRLFRIYNDMREWRYYNCIADKQVNVLVGLISKEFSLDRLIVRQFLYTIKVLELINCPLNQMTESVSGFTPSLTNELLKFFKNGSVVLLEKYINHYKDTEQFPLFMRIALIQDLEGLTEFTKDFYSIATLHIPIK